LTLTRDILAIPRLHGPEDVWPWSASAD